MTVKEHVDEGQMVKFKYFQSGVLYYETAKGLEFTVPASDTGSGCFYPEQKAIQFMKWIKPAVAFQNEMAAMV